MKKYIPPYQEPNPRGDPYSYLKYLTSLLLDALLVGSLLLSSFPDYYLENDHETYQMTTSTSIDIPFFY